MPKRRRLLTPRSKAKQNAAKRVSQEENEDREPELETRDWSSQNHGKVSTARGRLKGLLEVLEPSVEESDSSYEPSPSKKERHIHENRKNSEDDDTNKASSARQSYVLKLFDRSVDLSQFEEDTPLYPICRAWMINQPKANYKEFGQTFEEPEPTEDSVELPGPEGPPVSRIPDLLPEQKETNKDNINLNYREAPPPTLSQLVRSHSARWAGVRAAWLAQARRVEARYAATQQLLNKISMNGL